MPQTKLKLTGTCAEHLDAVIGKLADGFSLWDRPPAQLEPQEAALPGIGAHVVVHLSATAATAQRFTLNHQGAMLGWEMSPEQLGDGRMDVRTPVERLYLTGHWTRPGGGITPVLVSALRAAEAVLGRAGTVVEG